MKGEPIDGLQRGSVNSELAHNFRHGISWNIIRTRGMLASSAAYADRVLEVNVSFKPGDVVQLKSGGPIMTVKSVSGDDAACIWFEKTKEHRSVFPTALLSAFRRRPIRVTF